SISLVARDWCYTRELTFGGEETRGAQFSVKLVIPLVYEPNAIVRFGRRRDELRVWQHNLGVILCIDIHPNDDPIAIPIERRTEAWIAVVRIVEHQIEDDQPRTGAKQAIKQKDPNFARPWEWPPGHQFKGAITRDLLRSNRIQLQRLLIDSQENKIIARGGFAAFRAQQVLETLLAPPRYGNKRQRRKKVTHDNHRRPKRADGGKGQTTVARQPRHRTIL